MTYNPKHHYDANALADIQARVIRLAGDYAMDFPEVHEKLRDAVYRMADAEAMLLHEEPAT